MLVLPLAVRQAGDGEDQRWGFVSQAGEYAYDLPHLFSTRRIGPDLTRVGLKYGDDWHYAHHWDPRLVVPDSMMPAFPWLYDQITVAVQEQDGMPQLVEDPGLRAFFTFNDAREIRLVPNPDGLAFARERDGVPVLSVELLPEPFSQTAVTIVAPTEEARAVVAYIQKLGMNRGQWRDKFEPQLIFVSELSIPASPEWIEAGKEVYTPALCRLSRRQGRRQRSGRYLHGAAATRLPGRHFQVPRDPGRLAAHGWGPVPHDYPRSAGHRHAKLARNTGKGSLGGDPIH